MRDAPVLSEVVETPQSQDRTPRCAILLAVSPAAATYRASGLVRWHLADIGVPPNVRLAPRERTLEPSPPLTEADMAGLLAASVTSGRVLNRRTCHSRSSMRWRSSASLALTCGCYRSDRVARTPMPARGAQRRIWIPGAQDAC